MVRPDMLDAIDMLAQQARGNSAPFGGLQILLIGDLCQLPPVITSGVKHVFEKEYGHKEAYFFDARAYREGNFKTVELTRVYRQSDTELLQHLQNIRKDVDIDESVTYFNTAKIRDMATIKTAVTITPYRKVADDINSGKLDAIQAEPRSYACKISGNFDASKETPAPAILTLKVGAQVIFNRNISPECINGTSAIVTSLEDDVIGVRLLGNNLSVVVGRAKWPKYAYEYNRDTGAVEEKEVGAFEHFPLQLGYALTIHKAQGKTAQNGGGNVALRARHLERAKRLADCGGGPTGDGHGNHHEQDAALVDHAQGGLNLGADLPRHPHGHKAHEEHKVHHEHLWPCEAPYGAGRGAQIRCGPTLRSGQTALFNHGRIAVPLRQSVTKLYVTILGPQGKGPGLQEIRAA